LLRFNLTEDGTKLTMLIPLGTEIIFLPISIGYSPSLENPLKLKCICTLLDEALFNKSIGPEILILIFEGVIEATFKFGAKFS